MLRFGTDGVRGDANADLTTPLVVALGRAAARVLGSDRFVVGRDTRESGPRIEDDLVAGLGAEGARASAAGVLPTPGIAFLATREHVPAAIVSASHNLWTDNGVKIIGADGRKLPDDAEAAIEQQLRALVAEAASARAAAVPLTGAADAYLDHLVGALRGRTLGGLAVVLDCANGAASGVGPRALRAAGADVHVLSAQPDGRNINAGCGSTHPEKLQAAVPARGAALGLALDGDADRCLAVDEHGELVDGDQIMTMMALDLHARGRLRNHAIAVTVMSNLGLRRALADTGIGIVETPVGDRHVVAALEQHGLALGGEQSGHLVFADLATTGDGLLTGLLVCDLVARSGRPLSALAAQMRRFPQVLVNVRCARAVDLDHAPDVRREVRAVEADLGDSGRVLVRASGTEPVVRIMAQATTEAQAAAAAERCRRAVERAFAAG